MSIELIKTELERLRNDPFSQSDYPVKVWTILGDAWEMIALDSQIFELEKFY